MEAVYPLLLAFVIWNNLCMMYASVERERVRGLNAIDVSLMWQLVEIWCDIRMREIVVGLTSLAPLRHTWVGRSWRLIVWSSSDQLNRVSLASRPSCSEAAVSAAWSNDGTCQLTRWRSRFDVGLRNVFRQSTSGRGKRWSPGERNLSTGGK
jgi:hypothetical protein